MMQGCCLQEKQVVEFDNARILVADQKIESIKEIIPVLEKVSQANAPLLIITEDITGRMLALLYLVGTISFPILSSPEFSTETRNFGDNKT